VSQAAEALVSFDDDAARRHWRREDEAHVRGLEQLRRLKARALTDPQWAQREANELLVSGEVELVPDERGVVPSDEALVAGYYDRLIAEYESRRVTVRWNLGRLGWAAPAPRLLLVADRVRPRARGARTRRLISHARRRTPARQPDDDPDPVTPAGRAAA
jgi:hypothetical protein